MTRAVLVIALSVLALLSPGAARAEPLWLVVGAADPTPAGIARKAKTLAGVAPDGGLIVQLGDCGEKKNAFVWATAVAPSAKAAQAALAEVRDQIKKATIKRCDARPVSLLAFGISAVDPTIGEAPKPSATWSAADRIANLRLLAGGRALVITHHFVHQAEDPLGGRRERVLLALGNDQKKVLTDDCPSAGAVVVGPGGTQVALHCGREPAGSDRYHATLAFDREGTKLAQVEHCREPRFAGDAVVCDEERVDREGAITLHPKRVPLAR